MSPFQFKLSGTPLHYDSAGQMTDDLRRRAQEFGAKQTLIKDNLQTVEQFEEHREQVRRHLLEAIGGLPTEKTPLNARVTGTLTIGNCTVEKIIFESQPGYYVTALCYVPQQKIPQSPAVLFVCGHCDEGKAHPVYQHACLDLAANGFIVLAFDPIAQGERLQYLQEGKNTQYSDTAEHSYAGLPFVLQGASVARHFVWDGIRALDYLLERGDVDAERIGITGNSGGGLQTALLMVLEPRLAAGMPCTWITSLQHMMVTGFAQDMEQIVYGAMSRGPEHDDYLSAMAPRPVLVGAAAYDPFPIEGSLHSLERARKIYALYGVPEKVEIFVDPAEHNYTPGLRQACVNWFRQHLKNESPNFITGEAPVVEVAALQVTQTGQVAQEFLDSRTIFDLNCELLDSKQQSYPAVAEMRTALAQTLAINSIGCRKAMIRPRLWFREHEGYQVEDTWFFSAPEVVVAGPLLLPQGTVRSAVLLVLDNGTTDLPENTTLIQSFLQEDKAVFVFDPRGIGSVRARSTSASEVGRENDDSFHRQYPFFSTNYKLACDAMMLGMSTLGLRVFDVLRAFDYLQERLEGIPVEIYGGGRGAIWSYYAAVLEERFSAVTCADMLSSYRGLCRTRFYDASHFNLDIMAWGLLNCGDLEELRPCIEPRPLTFIRPRDAQNHILID